MTKSCKKKRAGKPARATAKGKSKQKKKGTASKTKNKCLVKGTNKSSQKKTCKMAAGATTSTKSSLEASVQTPPKPSLKAAFGTPPKKATKSAAVLTTPSTVSSRSTTESKRAVTLMSGLDLKSPLQKKNKACDREEASLVDSVDYEDPATIAWKTKGGVASAIRHHFLDYDERLKLP